MTYDWHHDEWTVPLNISAARTVVMGTTPVKLELELSWYPVQPDAFGPEWMLGFNVTPVVPNVIDSCIKGLGNS